MQVLLDGAGQVKVADFGLAGITSPFSEGLTTYCGTPEFAAPDLLAASYNGHAVDLWSLGVILYELLQGFVPFRGPDLHAITRAALRGECAALPQTLSADCRDLVGRLLCPQPAGRITMEEVKRHPWVAGELTLFQADPALSSGGSSCSVSAGEVGEGGGAAGVAGGEQEGREQQEDGSGVQGAAAVRSTRGSALLSRSASNAAGLAAAARSGSFTAGQSARHDSLSLVVPGLEALAMVGEGEEEEQGSSGSSPASTLPPSTHSSFIEAGSSRRGSTASATGPCLSKKPLSRPGSLAGRTGSMAPQHPSRSGSFTTLHKADAPKCGAAAVAGCLPACQLPTARAHCTPLQTLSAGGLVRG